MVFDFARQIPSLVSTSCGEPLNSDSVRGACSIGGLKRTWPPSLPFTRIFCFYPLIFLTKDKAKLFLVRRHKV